MPLIFMLHGKQGGEAGEKAKIPPQHLVCSVALHPMLFQFPNESKPIVMICSNSLVLEGMAAEKSASKKKPRKLAVRMP